MALTQRPASRFFAAFYRWNRYSHCSYQPAVPPYKHNGLLPPTKTCTRSYRATHRLRQHLETTNSGAVQPAGGTAAGQFAAERPIELGQKQSENTQSIPTDADDLDTETARLQNEVRTLMRMVPTSVAIVTVASYDPGLLQYVPMGVAVSSLSTVSFNPPTISFNLKQPSKTLDAIRAANGLFRVHFPAGDRGGARLVELFSQGNHEDAYNLRLKDTKVYVPGVGTGEKRATASRAPQLWNDSVRAAMECSLTQELSVADHVILVAKIDSLESKIPQEPILLYLDRSCMRHDGTRVNTYVRGITGKESDSFVWNYSLFQGEDERRNCVQQIQSYIRANPQCICEDRRETFQAISTALPFSPSAFGIDLVVLVDEYKRESGKWVQNRPADQDAPILSDFYGRLSPTDRTKLIERTIALIRADPQFLTLNFRVLLHHLRVNRSVKDLLPSDILEPLRAAGLAPPFQPRMGTFSNESRDYNLQYLEQVERGILERMAAIGHKQDTSMVHMVEFLGEHKAVATYFKSNRNRLQAAAAPNLYHPSVVDIFGHLTPADALVVIARVIQYMNPSNLFNLRRGLNTDTSEILRLVGVHPCISGPSTKPLNVDFLFNKIRHIYLSTRHFRDVESGIDEMLAPYFAKTVTWDGLEERVKSLVRSQPTRAMKWPNADRLAAMGLDAKATLQVPIASEQQDLSRGVVIETLVAKELKSLYGKASPQDNQAIARFLHDTYRFDVKAATQQPLSPGETTTSSDEMLAAAQANRHVDVKGERDRRQEQRRQTAQYNEKKAAREELRGDEPVVRQVVVKFHPKHAKEFRGDTVKRLDRITFTPSGQRDV